MGDRLFHYQETAEIKGGVFGDPPPRVLEVDARWGDERAARELEGLQLKAVSSEDAEGAEHLRQLVKWAKKARVGGWIERKDPTGRIRRCYCTSVKGHQ